MWKAIKNLNDSEIREFQRRFRKKARFLIDESLGVGAARMIQERGYNAVYVGDIGLTGRDDTDIMAYAWREDRILLTHDRDFLNRSRFPDHRNPGVVVLPGAAGSTEGLEMELARVIVVLAPYREAHRFQRIEATNDGVWTIHEPTGSRRVRFRSNGEVDEWQQ
jgi:predicted nuclease of predicted toxin-antitoxin system